VVNTQVEPNSIPESAANLRPVIGNNDFLYEAFLDHVFEKH